MRHNVIATLVGAVLLGTFFILFVFGFWFLMAGLLVFAFLLWSLAIGTVILDWYEGR